MNFNFFASIVLRFVAIIMLPVGLWCVWVGYGMITHILTDKIESLAFLVLVIDISVALGIFLMGMYMIAVSIRTFVKIDTKTIKHHVVIYSLSIAFVLPTWICSYFNEEPNYCSLVNEQWIRVICLIVALLFYNLIVRVIK